MVAKVVARFNNLALIAVTEQLSKAAKQPTRKTTTTSFLDLIFGIFVIELYLFIVVISRLSFYIRINFSYLARRNYLYG